MRVFSVIFFVLSIIYVVVPVDYDGTIIGYIDDFMFFMSSFCLLYANFMDKYNVRSVVLLKMLSALFSFVGALSLLLLVLFSK